MRTSDNGLDAIAEREGIRTRAYQDSVGVWTIGVGHTSSAGPPHVVAGLQITEDEAMRIFAKDIIQYENAVQDCIDADLNQNQFDALVSLCYNIGPGAFRRSSLVRDINAGADRDTINNDFMKWNRPSVIIGRRRREVEQYNS